MPNMINATPPAVAAGTMPMMTPNPSSSCLEPKDATVSPTPTAAIATLTMPMMVSARPVALRFSYGAVRGLGAGGATRSWRSQSVISIAALSFPTVSERSANCS